MNITNVTSVLNSTLSTLSTLVADPEFNLTSTATSIPSTAAAAFPATSTSISTATSTVSTLAPGMKFREDGLREPPSFVAANNIIIMVIGLAILIVPVMGFLVCLCARTKLFQTIRGLRFTAHDGEGVNSALPYSHFDSESEEVPKKSKGKSQPNDVRVLISSDNVTGTGSPNKNSRIRGTRAPILPGSSSSTSLVDDYNGVDATFIMPRSSSAVVETSAMEQYS